MAISTWVAPTPPDPETLRNPPPFAPFPLHHLRSGKIKHPWGPNMPSAIYKTPHSGPVEINVNGITTDEHGWPDHRTTDKAILHYCARHYDDWKSEIPSSEVHFKPGAFGENLFSDEVSEKTLCIGDKIEMGEVILELTEPRAPCYKLNHRFEVIDMARRTQTLFRTGWLYRVLRSGTVNPGDMIRLLERPYPEWTVARIMYYLYLEKDNMEIMKEIVQITPLGEAIKKLFRTRLEKGATEDQNGRMFGDETLKMDSWNEYRVVEKRRETSTVTAFVLEAIDELKEATPVEPGSHVKLKLGGKLVRAYSVIGGSTKRFELGIALDAQSRGGSKFLHEQTQRGHVLTAGRINASFPLAQEADKHVIIAGGIGITAFLAALKHLKESKKNYELHFAVAEEVPFEKRITALGSNAKIYNKAQGHRLDVDRIVSLADSNTHIYCCGPQRLMDGVDEAAKRYSVPTSCIHFEAFTVTTSGDPFTAELKESKKTVEVDSTQTLLDALKAVGMDIDSSCEVGNCGTCKIDVCQGRVLHKGTGLMEEEKGSAMLSCVSRGIGHIVLDL